LLSKTLPLFATYGALVRNRHASHMLESVEETQQIKTGGQKDMDTKYAVCADKCHNKHVRHE
jgi:hypothetical protein